MSQLLKHFGFHHPPFARQTGTDALYKHSGFEEAFGRLRFSYELRLIAALIADIGCGKSVLLGQLADEAQQGGAVVHYFAHSTTGPFGMMNVLARKVGTTPKRSRAETAELITEKLLESGKPHLLIIDEAHELPDATLEDIKLLTITDFDRKSPFVLTLAGLPSLDDRLAEPVHHALDQRITTVARLAPLSLEETRTYIDIRLKAAGADKKKQPVFEDGAVGTLFNATNGVPRRINNLATSALIVAASRKRRLVSPQDIQDALLDRGRA